MRTLDSPERPERTFASEVRRRRGNEPVASAAKRAGISARRWHQIEAGQEIRGGDLTPTFHSRRVILDVARALNWNAEDALSVANEERRKAGKAELDTSNLEDFEEVLIPPTFIDRYRKLSDEQRETVLAVVHTMNPPERFELDEAS
jgi:hypothetical protein